MAQAEHRVAHAPNIVSCSRACKASSPRARDSVVRSPGATSVLRAVALVLSTQVPHTRAWPCERHCRIKAFFVATESPYHSYVQALSRA